MSNDICKAFGIRVKRIRKLKGLSQEDLSLKSGLHRNYICDLERGARNVSLRAIEKIANGLEIGIKDLFEEDSTKGAFLFNGKRFEYNNKYELYDLMEFLEVDEDYVERNKC